jgi:hypothetical protein
MPWGFLAPVGSVSGDGEYGFIFENCIIFAPMEHMDTRYPGLRQDWFPDGLSYFPSISTPYVL